MFVSRWKNKGQRWEATRTVLASRQWMANSTGKFAVTCGAWNLCQMICTGPSGTVSFFASFAYNQAGF